MSPFGFIVNHLMLLLLEQGKRMAAPGHGELQAGVSRSAKECDRWRRDDWCVNALLQSWQRRVHISIKGTRDIALSNTAHLILPTVPKKRNSLLNSLKESI